MAGDDQTIEVVTFPKGKVLFKQGEKSDAAYIVQSGAVGMYREAQGRKIPLATVRKGELFGEMAAVDNSPRLATAFTLDESSLMVVPIGVMHDKLRKADPFIRAMIHMLMNNLRGVHESYMPRARSLADAVNMLNRQSETVTRFMQGDLPPAFRKNMEGLLANLESAIKDLRKVAAAHREDDKGDAVPSESDLPQ
jgi:CRP-like cAMP-binding protein